jgi:hypothetical protein
VVDTFYIEPSAAVRARAAEGERRIGMAGLGLAAVALGLCAARMTWAAVAAASTAAVFLVATLAYEVSLVTYVMVPAGALALAAGAAVDLGRGR